MLFKALPIVSLIIVASGCSSTQKGISVIEESGDKPSWATIERIQYREGDSMYFVGYLTVDGDSRPSAAINASGAKARAMPLQGIANAFVEQFGVAEDLRESSAKYVLSVLRKNPPNIPGLNVTTHYYQRLEVKGTDGIPRSELRAYSRADCPVSEYNEAKREALARLKGDPKIKKELDEIMGSQRARAYDERKPASASVADESGSN